MTDDHLNPWGVGGVGRVSPTPATGGVGGPEGPTPTPTRPAEGGVSDVPGPGEYPPPDILGAAARCCGYPRIVAEVGGRRVPVAPTVAAWRTFVRWAASQPAWLLAAWDALEAWEREMQAALADA
jgi:hypothetical protein